MSDIDIEILKEFQTESKGLITFTLEILESIEGDYKKVSRLEEYGQTVDRIMGGAKSLALTAGPDHFIHKVGDYAALCKAVGYKASQIKDNPQFYDICVALLLDATEMLQDMIDDIAETDHKNIAEVLTVTFLDRLRWVSSQFSPDVRASVDVNKGAKQTRMSQNDIDDLLAKLLG
jgi:hypothetical protein